MSLGSRTRGGTAELYTVIFGNWYIVTYVDGDDGRLFIRRWRVMHSANGFEVGAPWCSFPAISIGHGQLRMVSVGK